MTLTRALIHLGEAMLVAGAVGLLMWAAADCLLAWIARGEPDANGDPERDAGLIPEDPQKPQPRPWRNENQK